MIYSHIPVPQNACKQSTSAHLPAKRLHRLRHAAHRRQQLAHQKAHEQVSTVIARSHTSVIVARQPSAGTVSCWSAKGEVLLSFSTLDGCIFALRRVADPDKVKLTGSFVSRSVP